MDNLKRKTKAFSLIEIIQTVVLIGLIAAISTSFFRNVNVNEKLYISSRNMLWDAVDESYRQMCSTRPYCNAQVGAGNNAEFDGFWEEVGISCQTLWGNTSFYNPTTQRCEAPLPLGGVCPNLAIGAVAGVLNNVPANSLTQGGVLQTQNQTNINGFGLPAQMPQDGAICASDILICPGVGIGRTPQSESDLFCQAVPLAVAGAAANPAEPYDEALTQRTMTIDNNGITAQITPLCYHLWDLVNHKAQGADGTYDDLQATCAPNPATIRFNAPQYGANNVLTGFTNNNANTGYNMMLPNGVYLYFFQSAAGDPVNIVLKYDKNNTAGSTETGRNSLAPTKQETFGAINVCVPAAGASPYPEIDTAKKLEKNEDGEDVNVGFAVN